MGWRIAQLHVQDMADKGYFSHLTQNGKEPWERAEAHGISASGQNIAAGALTAESVLLQWKSSEGHCTNMMNSEFVLFAVGYGENQDSPFGTYWTQLFKAEDVPVDTSCYSISVAESATASDEPLVPKDKDRHFP